MIEIFLDSLVLLLVFLIFLGSLYFGIGFIYHYYRNKTYLNVIIESIIIGLIFGYFIQVDGVGWLEWVLTCILVVISSGILALIIRRSNSKSPDKENKSDYRVNKEMLDKTDNLKKDKNIEDKVLKAPVKQSRIRTFEESIPFTSPEEIKLYHYNIKNPFKTFRRITVRSDKALGSETEAMDDVNEKLKERASNLGANAVIGVRYEKGIFTLFRGIRGIGQAVYIKDMENVEKKYPSGTVPILLGAMWVILGLLGYHDYQQFYIPFGLAMIILGISTRQRYMNKIFFLAFSGIIILGGLIWAKYVLKNGIQMFNPDFYFSTGLFALIVIIFIYSFKNRKDDPNISWRNNWGF